MEGNRDGWNVRQKEENIENEERTEGWRDDGRYGKRRKIEGKKDGRKRDKKQRNEIGM